MAFNDLEKKRIEKAMVVFLAKRRPPPHIRPDLDISYRLTVPSIDKFLAVVAADEYGCFFG